VRQSAKAAGFRMRAHEVTKAEGGCERFAQKLAQKPGRNTHCIRQFIIGKGLAVRAALTTEASESFA
jgi:hypothetical protein